MRSLTEWPSTSAGSKPIPISTGKEPVNIQLASLVLPVTNQADHIQSVIEEYIEVLQRSSLSYELQAG